MIDIEEDLECSIAEAPIEILKIKDLRPYSENPFKIKNDNHLDYLVLDIEKKDL